MAELAKFWAFFTAVLRIGPKLTAAPALDCSCSPLRYFTCQCQCRYRQHKIKCRSELYAMKHSSHAAGGGLCESDPPLISAANLGYGVATAAAIDDLAMTSLPLSLSPTCRHYESPYDVHRAVTWSRHHVLDDFSSDVSDGGHYGTKITHGTAQTLCPRRHRQVLWPFYNFQHVAV